MTERTPDGVDQHAPGAKNDAGKVRPSLVINGFPRALWELSRVATYGASKYTDGGWQHVQNAHSRYQDAQLRHALLGTVQGADKDTGIPHLAHEAWNALARLEMALRDRDPSESFLDAPTYTKP